MGNHLTCLSPAALKRLQTAPDCRIKFLNCDIGTLSELEGPLTAAEAMIEFPSQFLCCLSNPALGGRRIRAVLGNEDLQAAELYLLLPMHRLNSRFSMEEMALFENLEAVQASNGKQVKKGAISQSKVAPSPASTSDFSQNLSPESTLLLKSLSSKRLNDRKLQYEGPSSAFQVTGAAGKHALCRSRSWMPKLDTVQEYAVAL